MYIIFFFLINVSEEEVQLREGSGEIAGETRTAATSAAGAQRETSSGREMLIAFLFLPNILGGFALQLVHLIFFYL